MYIYIPLSLAVVACIGITIIISRKLPYLKKLTPESHQFGPTLFHDFFPEIVGFITRLHIERFIALVLREVEKLLRKIRLLFSRIDGMSTALINELRSATVRQQEPAPKPLTLHSEQPRLETNNIQVRPRNSGPNMEVLKSQEQQLIIDIAQNPKDGSLYARLGETYLEMLQFHDALESFEAALDLDRENQLLKERISVVQRKLHEAKMGF